MRNLAKANKSSALGIAGVYSLAKQVDSLDKTEEWAGYPFKLSFNNVSQTEWTLVSFFVKEHVSCCNLLGRTAFSADKQVLKEEDQFAYILWQKIK